MAPASQAAASAPASGLCAKATAGTLDGELAGDDAQVAAACETMRASYASANATFATTRAALRVRADEARAAVRAACEDSGSEGDSPGASARQSGGPSDACRAARQQARAALRQIGTETRAARRTHHVALKQARATFRTAVGALKEPAA